MPTMMKQIIASNRGRGGVAVLTLLLTAKGINGRRNNRQASMRWVSDVMSDRPFYSAEFSVTR